MAFDKIKKIGLHYFERNSRRIRPLRVLPRILPDGSRHVAPQPKLLELKYRVGLSVDIYPLF